MGILARFKDIMSSNIHSILNQSEEPEKVLNDWLRRLNADLGKVKAETASIRADESRARRALEECRTEIKKLYRYADKMVQDGREQEALKFLEMKAKESAKEPALQAAYDRSAANMASMEQMQSKLEADISALEARVAEMRGRLAAAQAKRNLNDAAGVMGAGEAALKALEEKAEQAYNEATAIAELRNGSQQEDLDVYFAEYENSKAAGPEAELAELKKKLNTQDKRS